MRNRKTLFRRILCCIAFIFAIVLMFVCYNLFYFEYELIGIQELKKGERIRFSFTKFRNSYVTLFAQGFSLSNNDFLVKYWIRDHLGNLILTGERYDAISISGYLSSGKYELDFELTEGRLDCLKGKQIVLGFPCILDPVVFVYGYVLYQGKLNGAIRDNTEKIKCARHTVRMANLSHPGRLGMRKAACIVHGAENNACVIQAVKIN